MVDNQQTLMEWISIYTDEYVTDMDFEDDHCESNDLKSLSFDDDFHVSNLMPVGEVKRYGIWCEVDGKLKVVVFFFFFKCMAATIKFVFFFSLQMTLIGQHVQ